MTRAIATALSVVAQNAQTRIRTVPAKDKDQAMQDWVVASDAAHMAWEEWKSSPGQRLGPIYWV